MIDKLKRKEIEKEKSFIASLKSESEAESECDDLKKSGNILSTLQSRKSSEEQ